MASAAQLEHRLRAAGRRRRRALERAEEELARIGWLARQAVAAGLPITRIEELADVSRPTLYKLLRGSG